MCAQGIFSTNSSRNSAAAFGEHAHLAREALDEAEKRVVRTGGRVSSISQSVRQAARRLLRARGFSIAAILTLMLGIGATTAVFSVVNAVLLRPLPYTNPEQLVDLSHTLSVSGVSRVDQSDAAGLVRILQTQLETGVYCDR